MNNIDSNLNIENKIKEFKNNNQFLSDKSDSFTFLLYILSKEYFEFKNNNDISKIADYIISDKEDAPINFMFTQILSSEEKTDLVVGKINYSNNSTLYEIYADITKTVYRFKDLYKS
ncbi:hypothetical protein J6P52_04150 [bacterium]|nr:hypothetical protein [bacterium]